MYFIYFCKISFFDELPLSIGTRKFFLVFYFWIVEFVYEGVFVLVWRLLGFFLYWFCASDNNCPCHLSVFPISLWLTINIGVWFKLNNYLVCLFFFLYKEERNHFFYLGLSCFCVYHSEFDSLFLLFFPLIIHTCNYLLFDLHLMKHFVYAYNIVC